MLFMRCSVHVFRLLQMSLLAIGGPVLRLTFDDELLGPALDLPGWLDFE